MSNLEDRDWSTLLERLDLEMSDTDLAAADRKLWELPDDDVVDVRPEWVEATVAKAVAVPEVVHEPVVEPVAEVAPSRRWGWWNKVQRFAAAAIAFMGLHTAATAATVVTAGVVVVVLVWSGKNSREDMPFESAMKILMDPSQAQDSREAALGEVGAGLTEFIVVLMRARTDQGALGLAAESETDLASLRAHLRSGTAPDWLDDDDSET